MANNQKLKSDQTQSADDILASLMEDLKDVDKIVSEDTFENDLGLDLDLLKSVKSTDAPDENLLQLKDDSLISSSSSDLLSLQPEDEPFALESIEMTDLEPSESTQGEKAHDEPAGLSEEISLFPSDENEEVSSSLFVSSESYETSNKSTQVQPNDDEATAELQITDISKDELQAGEFSDELNSNSAHANSEYDSDQEKTVAIAGYAKRNNEDYGDKVKVSVGQMRGQAMTSGYAAWGSADSNLVLADNLKIAQEKILELEKENEKLRSQNEELIAASEIVRERAELLTSQVHEFKADRDAIEQAFKNENNILKNQLHRKDAEIVKASMKIEEFESRIKFDLKKIRVRERELENRLELVRAEKNALVKSKDEQILDLRRKLDQVQLEVDSYRQKCLELNKIIDTNQESFKRTTRALRLAMANLELQDENKTPLKKVD